MQRTVQWAKRLCWFGFDARMSAYVQDLQADLEDVINANPQNDEERHALFSGKDDISVICWKK